MKRFRSAGILIGPLVLLVVMGLAAPALAAPRSGSRLTEFPLAAPGARPYQITAGPDGNLWFTEEDIDQIGRVTTDGAFTEYSTQTCCFPTEITSAGGFLWFTEEQGPAIVSMTTDGAVASRPYPSRNDLAYAIARGSDGNVYGSDIIGPHVVRVSPAG